MTASEKVTFTMTFGPRRLGLPASENGFQPPRKSFFVVVRFRPPEHNTLRPVWWFVFPLVLFDVLEGSLSALIYLGGTGLHGKS